MRWMGKRRLDHLSLLGLAAGLALMLQPWWMEGFRVGFFVVLTATIAQIIAGHLPAKGAT